MEAGFRFSSAFVWDYFTYMDYLPKREEIP